MTHDFKTWTIGDLEAEHERLVKERDELLRRSGFYATEERFLTVMHEIADRHAADPAPVTYEPVKPTGAMLMPDSVSGVKEEEIREKHSDVLAPEVEWSHDPALSGPRWRAFLTPGWELCVYEDGDWTVLCDWQVLAHGTVPESTEASPLMLGKRKAVGAYQRLRENKVRLAEENVPPVDLPVDWHCEPISGGRRWRSFPTPGWSLLVYDTDASWGVSRENDAGVLCPLEHGVGWKPRGERLKDAPAREVVVAAFHAVYEAYQRLKAGEEPREDVATHTYVTSGATHLCVEWSTGWCARLPNVICYAYPAADLVLGVYAQGDWRVFDLHDNALALGKAATVVEAQREAAVAVSQIIYRKEHGGTQ